MTRSEKNAAIAQILGYTTSEVVYGPSGILPGETHTHWKPPGYLSRSQLGYPSPCPDFVSIIEARLMDRIPMDVDTKPEEVPV